MLSWGNEGLQSLLSDETSEKLSHDPGEVKHEWYKSAALFSWSNNRASCHTKPKTPPTNTQHCKLLLLGGWLFLPFFLLPDFPLQLDGLRLCVLLPLPRQPTVLINHSAETMQGLMQQLHIGWCDIPPQPHVLVSEMCLMVASHRSLVDIISCQILGFLWFSA